MPTKPYGRVPHLLILTIPKDGDSTASLGSLFPNTTPDRNQQPQHNRHREGSKGSGTARWSPQGSARSRGERGGSAPLGLDIPPVFSLQNRSRPPEAPLAQQSSISGLQEAQSTPRSRGHTADIAPKCPAPAEGSAPEPSPAPAGSDPAGSRFQARHFPIPPASSLPVKREKTCIRSGKI